MKFKPLGQRILVEDIVEKYDGLLQLPPSSREKPTFQSIVIAISDEIENDKIKILKQRIAECEETLPGEVSERRLERLKKELVDLIVNPKIKVDDVICRGEFIGQILDLKLRHRVMNVADVLGKIEE